MNHYNDRTGWPIPWPRAYFVSNAQAEAETAEFYADLARKRKPLEAIWDNNVHRLYET